MKILLVDDDVQLGEEIAEFLEAQFGYEVTRCASGEQGLEIFRQERFNIILTDIRMPGMNGISFLKEIKETPEGRNAVFVVFSAYAELEYAIQAMRLGEYDFILKPLDIKELVDVIERIQKMSAGRPELAGDEDAPFEKSALPAVLLNKPDDSSYRFVPGIGRIGVFSKAMRDIVAVSYRFHEDRLMPVLIEGETGTGKEIIARMIHYGNSDDNNPFIPVNCSAIPASLFESELFGYEGGAFTSSRVSGMKGKFELAQGGTLFLDEIGDLPEELQPKLLRAIQEKEMYRVGGLKKIGLDVRIVCATNRNLDELVHAGKIRKDLYYRLDRGRVRIPALSQRKEDIAPLAQLFLEEFARQKSRRFRFIDREAVAVLEDHTWPGNVRELQNVIERSVLLYDDIVLKPAYLQLLSGVSEVIENDNSLNNQVFNISLPPDGLAMEKVETEIIKKVLLMFNGNKSRTSEYLGITRKTLRSKLSKA